MKFVLPILVFIFCNHAVAATGGFGAIAYSRSQNWFSESWSYPTQDTAEQGALKTCGLADCAAESTENGYLVLVRSEDDVFFARGPLRDPAFSEAMRACQIKSQDCHPRAWIYSDDKLTNNVGRVIAKPLDAVSLDAIGGPFDRSVTNFRGFHQEQSEWCWAAVTETLYFSLTGQILSQTELARIQMPADKSVRGLVDPTLINISATSCEGSQSTPICNHTGSASTALTALGVGAGFPQYPAPDSMASSLLAIRRSLERNVSSQIGA